MNYSVIKNGDLLLKPNENPFKTDLESRKSRGQTGASTVTYISNSKCSIIVDTGFEFESNMSHSWKEKNHARFIGILKKHDIHPEDIDYVFISHWHRDHYGNINVFKNSKILTTVDFSEPENNKVLEYLEIFEKVEISKIEKVVSGEEIVPGLKVVSTPGHTIDHASLILSAGEEKIAVAGDAILDEETFNKREIYKHNKDFYSEEEALESMNNLVSMVDHIIPGHGIMFLKKKG
jgi:glyoxylase-like metal-dependent hydrolase (beta-lactamase superfamily II)